MDKLDRMNQKLDMMTLELRNLRHKQRLVRIEQSSLFWTTFVGLALAAIILI